MYVIYITYTDDCTYCYNCAYGFAKTEIGAIKLEDYVKKENPNNSVWIEKIKFFEDKENNNAI